MATKKNNPDKTKTTLRIKGMHCASCAMNIENSLCKLRDTEAHVNYASKKATVEHPSNISKDEIIEKIQSAGYDVYQEEGKVTVTTEMTAEEEEKERDLNDLKRKVIVGAVLASVVMAIGNLGFI